MKKILIIAGGIILITLAVMFFLSPKPAEEGSELINGSPFGSSEGINIPALGTETVGTTTPFDDQNVSGESSLFRISNTPTAGFVALTRGSETVVRYVDRGTGHITDVTLPKTGAAMGLVRRKITNNTLPKIYEAYFRNDGSSVLLRSLEGDTDVVKNTSLTLTPPKATPASTSTPQATDSLYTVAAASLRGDLDSVMVGANNSLYYVVKNGLAIASSNFSGGDQRTLFSSAFTNWRLGRLGNNILVSTKASASAPGYAYSLPVSGGSLTKLLGPLNGLTVVANPNGTKLLYSYNEGGLIKSIVKNLQSSSISEIQPSVLADKCSWSNKNNNVVFCATPLNSISGAEPDNWYLGKTHFSDNIWKFDTDSEVAQVVAQPKIEFNVDIDGSDLRVTPQEDFLIFINKRDQTLWAVRLD